MDTTTFSITAWRQQLAKLAAQAYIGCGQSDTLFSQRLQASIDHALRSVPADHYAAALALAVGYGYDPCPNSDEAAGYCQDGIQLGHCPVGCGSGPND